MPANKKSVAENAAAKKKAIVEKITSYIDMVANTHDMSDEIRGYCIELLERLSRKRTINIASGQPKIWAGAIICVIARMNFLYDKSSPDYLPKSALCETLDVKDSTIGSKAGMIEKACKLSRFEEGLCKAEILNQFTFYTLPNGMVLSGDMLKRMGL
jgi:hypothetical protein